MTKRNRDDSDLRKGTRPPAVRQDPILDDVRPRTDPRIGNRWGRLVVSAFVLWHLFALTIWLLPESALRQSCVRSVLPYMTFTGLMQSWTMFSPEPSKLDLYVEARVTYADGKVRSWIYPRMTELGYLERYWHERFRKFIELAHLDQNRMVWPSLARYPARLNNIYPGNPPVKVQLVRHFRFTPPPGGEWPPYQTYAFFTLPILPRDLR
jgi:hypothetical protein